MICQSCGVEAPTKYVAFYRSIGVVYVHFHKSIQGELCKSCIHRYFWSFTAVNLFLGWWSHLSLLVNPFYILNNCFRYLTCLTLPSVSPEATEPPLTEEEIRKLRPYTDQLLDRLNRGRQFKEMAEDIAQLVGVTPGQVMCYVRAIAAQQQHESS